MKAYYKSALVALAATLVVSAAFAQAGATKHPAQTKTAQTKTATRHTAPKAPREHWMTGTVKSAPKDGSMTIAVKKKTYTVEVADAKVTEGKKAFGLDKLSVGSLVKVGGTLKGKSLDAKTVKVERVGPAKKKSSTKTGTSKKTSTKTGGTAPKSGTPPTKHEAFQPMTNRPSTPAGNGGRLTSIRSARCW